MPNKPKNNYLHIDFPVRGLTFGDALCYRVGFVSDTIAVLSAVDVDLNAAISRVMRRVLTECQRRYAR